MSTLKTTTTTTKTRVLELDEDQIEELLIKRACELYGFGPRAVVTWDYDHNGVWFRIKEETVEESDDE